jgi:hypothetical protein
VAVHIYIIDRFGNELKAMGFIDSDKFRFLTQLSKTAQLNCAAYLDFIGDTILNQKQSSALKIDLEKLKIINST